MKNRPELGWNYLYTGYTGTTINTLSGNKVFPFIKEDMGVADALAKKELKS
jgi:hypothetical protein